MDFKIETEGCKGWGLFSRRERPLLIAGPCSAESKEQVMETASRLREAGVEAFRAGIWKPRTRPNCFEGVGEEGLAWLSKTRRETGIKVGTEVAKARHVEACLKAGLDFLWLGARTTANPFAVQEIAEALKGTDIAVLVKNPVNPDINLWIGALERLSMAGISKLGAIHRGFSTYDSGKYRNAPQWQIAIDLKREIKPIPLFCDPSHIGGQREYVREIAQKGMDLGFDGLIVEVHPNPDKALSDAQQQLTPKEFIEIMSKLVIRTGQVADGDSSMEAWRERIDQLDRALMRTLTERMRVCEQIGEYKKAHNLPVLQTDRWEKILSRVVKEAEENRLPRELAERIFKAIHQASIDRQTEIMEGQILIGHSNKRQLPFS